MSSRRKLFGIVLRVGYFKISVDIVDDIQLIRTNLSEPVDEFSTKTGRKSMHMQLITKREKIKQAYKKCGYTSQHL